MSNASTLQRLQYSCIQKEHLKQPNSAIYYHVKPHDSKSEMTRPHNLTSCAVLGTSRGRSPCLHSRLRQHHLVQKINSHITNEFSGHTSQT